MPEALLAADTPSMRRIRYDKLQDNLDVAWKYLIEEMFPEFLMFYFPATADLIDWSTESSEFPGGRTGTEEDEAGARTAPWRFLNQELQQIHPDAETGGRVVDRLVEVRLKKTATPQLIHIEVQNQPDTRFAERMYSYHSRIFDRFRCPVESLALLTDTSPGWRPAVFETSGTSTSGRLVWQVAKLLDYRGQEDELMRSGNPFGWVTLAHLAAQRTQGKPVGRMKAKKELMRLAVSREWERKRIIRLFRGLDFMMRLPPDINRLLWQEALEQGRSDVELPLCDFDIVLRKMAREQAIKAGREEGRQEGREEGLEKGRAAEAALVCRQLTRRFGRLPADLKSKVMAGSFEELDRWGFRLLDVDSLAEVFEQD